MRLRLVLGAVGFAMAAFGALRFLQLGLAKAFDAVIWLAAGVAVHDGVVAPLTIALTVVAVRFVPMAARSRVVVALVVVATVTVSAVPVLGRWGARPDNPTLLPRHYGLGWLAFLAVVVLVTLLSVPVGRALRGRRSRVSPSGR